MTLLIPSYKAGFARNAAESAYPNRWKDLVGLWAPCLGPTGVTLRDQGRFQNHGTLTNMAPATDWAVTDKGYALNFDGNDQWVIAGPQSFQTDTPITVLCWHRTTDGNTHALVSKSPGTGGASNTGWILFYHGDDHVRVRFYEADNSRHDADVGSGLADGEWHQFGFVYDGSTQLFSIADGVWSAPTAVVGHAPAAATNLQIGKYGGSAAAGVHDDILLVACWERALTSSEVWQHYADPHGILRLRTSVPLDAGLNIPIAMRHYMQMMGAA